MGTTQHLKTTFRTHPLPTINRKQETPLLLRENVFKNLRQVVKQCKSMLQQY